MAYYYNDYSRMNAARAKRKALMDAYANYTPPTTYKDRKPNIEDFGLQNIDINKIKSEYGKYVNKTNDYQSFCGFYFIGGFILDTIIISLLEKSLSKDDITFLFWIIWLAPIIISYLLSLKKFKYQNLYNTIQKYENALFQYDWWQKKKRKEYWYVMSGRKFEISISHIFKNMGYDTKICKQGGDEGIDIEIFKNGIHEIIQCKAHKNKVSPSVARDLYGTMNANNVKKAYLITLNGATSGTIEFCRKHNIEIWDIDDILRHQDEL